MLCCQSFDAHDRLAFAVMTFTILLSDWPTFYLPYVVPVPSNVVAGHSFFVSKPDF